ncbi:CbiX/SirB N-terminal domain-containing protein [Streptomyces capparidis]
MTAPASSPLLDPHHLPLDSSAQLMSQINVQLTGRLARLARPAARRPALVAVAHGSRVPEAAATARALLDRVRALRPSLPVHLGHIELSAPLVDDTLASLDGAVVLVPLLLSRGYHVRTDLPGALARAPHLTGTVAAPLGPHPLLARALHDRLTEAGWRRTRRGAVVLAAAGSLDPHAAVDAGRTAALLRARLGVPVLPAYASAARPTVDEAVADLAARGHRDIAVASYFTAPGRFPAQCAAKSPTVAAAPLGAHDALAELVLQRYDEALTAAGTGAVPAASALAAAG